MSGNARGPSTAFNLLYRLCQVRRVDGDRGLHLAACPIPAPRLCKPLALIPPHTTRAVQLKPDVRQVRQMLDHVDSTFIRAVSRARFACSCCAHRLHCGRASVAPNPGFRLSPQIGLLYLRYVCDPRQLWDWFRNYVRDEEVGEMKAAFGRQDAPLLYCTTSCADLQSGPPFLALHTGV